MPLHRARNLSPQVVWWRTVAGPAFGSQDIADTPFCTANDTQRLIADQQPASAGDAPQNDPAVRMARGFGGAHYRFGAAFFD